jgi:F-type H+-transporting ATPase subunit b
VNLFKRSVRHLILAVCLQGLPLAALAAEPAGEHGGDAHHPTLDYKRLAQQLLNFAVLVAILGYFGGRGINKALAARHEQVKRDLEEAVQARAAAEERLKAQERRLANLEKEVTALRTSIKEEALLEEKRLLAAAEEKAKRIQEETRFLMDQEVKAAEIRFREEVAAQAVRIAEEVVLRSVKPEDDKRLNQSFVADLEQGRPAPSTQEGGGGSSKVISGRESADEAVS